MGLCIFQNLSNYVLDIWAFIVCDIYFKKGKVMERERDGGREEMLTLPRSPLSLTGASQCSVISRVGLRHQRLLLTRT